MLIKVKTLPSQEQFLWYVVKNCNAISAKLYENDSFFKIPGQIYYKFSIL